MSKFSNEVYYWNKETEAEKAKAEEEAKADTGVLAKLGKIEEAFVETVTEIKDAVVNGVEKVRGIN